MRTLIVIAKVKFPMGKAQQAAEVYAKVMSERPVPDGIKHIGPFIKSTLEDGIVTISFYEVEEGKEIEALKYANELEIQFRGIEGYAYQVDIYYTVEEALALLV
ncbi:MAG: hypothetical protein ACETWM_22705 [Candidatus Lokiarchaeia archaeon]